MTIDRKKDENRNQIIEKTQINSGVVAPGKKADSRDTSSV